MKVNCNNCKIEFDKKPYQIKNTKKHFCSSACCGEYSKKQSSVTMPCLTCGKLVTRTKAALKKAKGNNIFCNHSCSASYSNQKRLGTGYTSYRRQAFGHYKHKCDICNYDSVIEILQVHHIDRNRRNHKIDNLQILCPNCHSIEHLNN